MWLHLSFHPDYVLSYHNADNKKNCDQVIRSEDIADCYQIVYCF